MEFKNNAFFVALITSLSVGICGYFVLFGLLRTDILEARVSIASSLEGHDALLSQVFDNNLSVIQEAIVHNVSEASRSVVSIVASKNVSLYLLDSTSRLSIAEKEAKIGGGSGIVASKSGYIITNRHVVEDTEASYTIITHDGVAYAVKNVWMDPSLDIAVIAIDDPDNTLLTHTQVASFVGLDEDTAIGQFVFAIGNALTELQNTVTLGIVSAKNRELQMQGNNVYVGLIQTDTSINPGNSGGPLLNIYGKVVGINTAINQFAQGIGFALPVTQEFVDRTLASVQLSGQIVRPFVGIVYTDITPEIRSKMNISVVDHGIYITDIVPGSPASFAGLQGGDIVVSINDLPVDTHLPFLYQLYTYSPGDTIRFHILRSGDSMYRDVVLGQNI